MAASTVACWERSLLGMHAGGGVRQGSWVGQGRTSDNRTWRREKIKSRRCRECEELPIYSMDLLAQHWVQGAALGGWGGSRLVHVQERFAAVLRHGRAMPQ